MSLITVDQEKCNQDGICARVCPVGIIDFPKGGYPRLVEGGEEFCVTCGHCVAVCPTAALDHQAMTSDDCPPVRDLKLSADDVAMFLRSRRSIRVYRQKPVADETIAQAIEVARFAPSGHNYQSPRWLVINGREKLEPLCDLVVGWMHAVIKTQPAMAELMHMDRVIEHQAHKDVILRGAPALAVCYADKADRYAPQACTIACAYLELAAPSLGLGACWAGYFNAAANFFPPMQEALALPEGCVSFGAIMLGYPQFSYHRLPLRNKADITWR